MLGQKSFEEQYLQTIQRCLNEGIDKPSRGEVGQRSIFGVQMRANLQAGFPILTTRKISFKIVAYELLWILRGHTSIKFLQDNGVHIWDKFTNENGEVGPIYQWRNWRHSDIVIDQLKTVINEIKENPTSKRLVVSSWNAGELDQMAVPPCPHMFQFIVAGGTLHCVLTQRAGDILLGVPYDLALYALLTNLVAQVTNLKPGEVIHNIADCHIYHNHLETVKKLLNIEPGRMPQLILNKGVNDIDDFDFSHMRLENYHPLSKLTGDVTAVPLFKTFI